MSSGVGCLIYSEDELRRLLAGGEGQFVEFRSLWDHGGPRRRVVDRAAARAMLAEAVAAFANSDGGTLLLGVNDDGTPSGHGYPDEVVNRLLSVPAQRVTPPLRPRCQRIELDGAEVIVVAVEPSAEAVMVEGNGFPYRVGDAVVRETQESINHRKIGYRRSGFEQRICLDATLEDLDLGLAEQFLARVAEAGRDVLDVLERYRLVHHAGAQRWRITNAALLLFARESTLRWHPNAEARVFRVDGTERQHGGQRNVRRLAQFDWPLARLIDGLADLVGSHIRRSEVLRGLYFEDTPEYPDFAWQEALVNAVAHRDYDDFGRGIEVWLYDDRMVVSSPGALVPPVTLDRLRAGGIVHASRNPLLVRVLSAAGITRNEGEGVARMFREMDGMGLAPPEFGSDDDACVVTLRNESTQARNGDQRHPSADAAGMHRRLSAADAPEADAAPVPAAETRLAQLRLHLLSLTPLLDGKGAVSNSDYRSIFGVDRRQALADLTTLTDAGLLELRGTKRGAHYVRPTPRP